MNTHIACFSNHLLILVFAFSQSNAVHVFVKNITQFCSKDLHSYWLNHPKGFVVDVICVLTMLCLCCCWIQKIIPPVLKSFTDQDSRVRYYACEALYNIAKVGGLILSLES